MWLSYLDNLIMLFILFTGTEILMVVRRRMLLLNLLEFWPELTHKLQFALNLRQKPVRRYDVLYMV
jgi:hypothetical protein